MTLNRMTAPPSSAWQKLHLNVSLNGNRCCSLTTSCSFHQHHSHPARRRELPVSRQPVMKLQHFVCVSQNTVDGELYERAFLQNDFRQHVVASWRSFNALPSSFLWCIHKRKGERRLKTASHFQKINQHISHAKARSQREFEWTPRQVSLTLPGYVQVGLLFFFHQQIFLLNTDFPPLAPLSLLSLSILLFFVPPFHLLQHSLLPANLTFFVPFCSSPCLFFHLPLLPLLSVRSCLLWAVPDSYKSANVNHHVLAFCSIGCTGKATKSLLIWMWYTPRSLTLSVTLPPCRAFLWSLRT